MRSLIALILLVSLPFAAVSCGGDSECSEPTGASDGKLHPSPNGKHAAEDVTCKAMTEALADKAMALNPCIYTSPVCPGFLRADYGEGKEYDQGTVDACIQFFQSKTTCDELRQAPDGCVLTIYPTPKVDSACP